MKKKQQPDLAALFDSYCEAYTASDWQVLKTFQEMPLDKAGRLIASLSRTETYEQRVRQDMKKKAELAFDQLEAELMAAIKQHPELAGELHDVLSRAREKVLDDGED